MPVEVVFEPNMAKVTAAVDRLVADARSKPVVVPVTAGGMAGRSPDPPSMAGFGVRQNRPTVSGVLGGDVFDRRPTSLANDLGRRSPRPPPNPWELSGRRTFGVSMEGLSDYLTVGFAARTLATGLSASRQLNIDTVLAGNDQAAQTEAVLKYRQSLISSGGFVGHAVGYLQDPSGMGEAGIRATLSGAEAQDARTRGMVDQGRFTANLRDRAEIAETTNPYERRLRQAESAHRKEREMIDDTAKKQMDADQKIIDERKKQMDADRRQRANASFGTFAGRDKTDANIYIEGHTEERDRREAALKAKDDAELAGMRGELGQKREQRMRENMALEDRRFKAETAEDRRAESFRQRLSVGAAAFQAQEAVYSILGDAAGVRRTRQAAGTFQRLTQASRDRVGAGEFAAIFGSTVLSTFADIVDERRAAFQGGQRVAGDAAVTQALLDRNPLAARLQQIENDRLAAIGAPGADAGAINNAARLRSELATRQAGEDRHFRDLALANRGRQLDAELGDPVFGRLGARSLGITQDAMAAAEKLATDDPAHSGNAIARIFANAEKEQELLSRDFLNSFRPQEFDFNRTNLTGTGNGGDVLDVLRQIAKNTANLKNQGPPRAQ